MFKKGDIIVCVDSGQYKVLPESLTLGKRYKVLHNSKLVEVLNDNNAAHSYSKTRFITAQQDRRLKLEKLCLKLEVK